MDITAVVQGRVIIPGKYETRDGRFALIISQKTMNDGRVIFWHGQVLERLTQRRGFQNAWDENGRDMSGNTRLDLIAPAYIDATTTTQ